MYEQPLSERMRVFLRLESLFSAARGCAGLQSEWASRAAIEYLNEIAKLLGRTELKQEIIRELEKHRARLKHLQGNPEVDDARLLGLLSQLETLVESTHGVRGQIGHELRRNEFLTQVRQRSHAPGGARDFDMPGFHFWLSRLASERQKDISDWLESTRLQEKAIGMILHLLRESSQPTEVVAESGSFRQNLEGQQSCELVRVNMGVALSCYPEISGSRHRISVRFMHWPGDEQRPAQTDDDVPFLLYCCGA